MLPAWEYMQSLERAFNLLGIIASHPDGVSFGEIAKASALPEGTVGRLLAALDDLGAIERLDKAKGYRIGDALIALGSAVPFERQLKVMARPYLLDLAAKTLETVSLGLYYGDQAIFIDQVDSGFELRTTDYTQMRYPLHAVSTGKVFLAHFSTEQLDAYLAKPLVAYTKNTMTHPAELQKRFEQIRKDGFVETLAEAEEGLCAYAAPVFSNKDDVKTIVAAVAVTAPMFRVDSERKENIILHLQQCCKALSQRLSQVNRQTLTISF